MKRSCKIYQYKHDRNFKKQDVPNILNEVTKVATFRDSIRNDFKSCGLLSFNTDNFDYTKCTLQTKSDAVDDAQISEMRQISRTSHLSYLESKIHPELLLRFQKSRSI